LSCLRANGNGSTAACFHGVEAIVQRGSCRRVPVRLGEIVHQHRILSDAGDILGLRILAAAKTARQQGKADYG
jgi:hypothetical protein